MADCCSVCLRWTYQEFFSRYRVLMKQKDVLPDKKLTCRNVMEQLVQVRLGFYLSFTLKEIIVVIYYDSHCLFDLYI